MADLYFKGKHLLVEWELLIGGWFHMKLLPIVLLVTYVLLVKETRPVTINIFFKKIVSF